MKKGLLLLVLLSGLSLPQCMSAEKKGGLVPAALTCCFGPRVGLEYNEGKPVEASEWLRFVFIGEVMNCLEAYQKNGCAGCILEGFIGPRVGREYDRRDVRTLEWIGLATAGLSNIIIVFEAFEGKTMTEVEQQEHLSK